jgi:hypothetical protein
VFVGIADLIAWSLALRLAAKMGYVWLTGVKAGYDVKRKFIVPVRP